MPGSPFSRGRAWDKATARTGVYYNAPPNCILIKLLWARVAPLFVVCERLEVFAVTIVTKVVSSLPYEFRVLLATHTIIQSLHLILFQQLKYWTAAVLFSLQLHNFPGSLNIVSKNSTFFFYIVHCASTGINALESSPGHINGQLLACVGDRISLTCSRDFELSSEVTRWTISSPISCGLVIHHFSLKK